MQDEILAVYEKEEKIKELRDKLNQYSFNDLKKTQHLEYSILEKGTDVNLLKEKFTEFSRIKIITKRQHKTNNKITYDFYYELNDGTYLLYAIALVEPKPILINAFHVERNFKRFKKSLINAYKKQLIG
jgi:hypothetical protein